MGEFSSFTISTFTLQGEISNVSFREDEISIGGQLDLTKLFHLNVSKNIVGIKSNYGKAYALGHIPKPKIKPKKNKDKITRRRKGNGESFDCQISFDILSQTKKYHIKLSRNGTIIICNVKPIDGEIESTDLKSALNDLCSYIKDNFKMIDSNLESNSNSNSNTNDIKEELISPNDISKEINERENLNQSNDISKEINERENLNQSNDISKEIMYKITSVNMKNYKTNIPMMKDRQILLEKIAEVFTRIKDDPKNFIDANVDHITTIDKRPSLVVKLFKRKEVTKTDKYEMNISIYLSGKINFRGVNVKTSSISDIRIWLSRIITDNFNDMIVKIRCKICSYTNCSTCNQSKKCKKCDYCWGCRKYLLEPINKELIYDLMTKLPTEE